MEQWIGESSHIPKVAGSNPAPATKNRKGTELESVPLIIMLNNMHNMHTGKGQFTIYQFYSALSP
jgi:hypothetical protein